MECDQWESMCEEKRITVNNEINSTIVLTHIHENV